MTRSVVVRLMLAVAVLTASAPAAGAEENDSDRDRPVNQGLQVSAASDGQTVRGQAGFDPVPVSGEGDGDGDGGGGTESASAEVQGPVCWYEPLRYTTQEEQRTEIRPEEQRPGLWGWEVCDDGSEEFRFFPDSPNAPAPEPVDPAALADEVTITPGVPTVRTSPPSGALHLVNLESWFWVDPADWQPDGGDAQAGPVTVDVTATPATLVIDPGDGSAPLRCPGGGTPYDPDLPADAQTSTCTHTYSEAGTYTATATVVYEVTWTSNIAPGGTLPDITPPGEPFEIRVAEAQAVVVDR